MKNNVLQTVFYDLFESEINVLDSLESYVSHTIDRELCLEFTSGKRIFISWCNVPVKYAVGMGATSFFEPENSIRLDASSHPIWKGIIGQPVELFVLNDDYQVIELQSPVGSIYFSTFENGYFGADVITVSRKMP
jgi:hypothetical protein